VLLFFTIPLILGKEGSKLVNFSFLLSKKRFGIEGKKKELDLAGKEQIAQVRKVLGSENQGLIVMVRG
jgi:hypothetical protein